MSLDRFRYSERATTAGPGAGVGLLQRLIALRTVAPFADLPPEELAVAAEYARERHLPAGTVLYRQGRTVTQLQLILRGRVDVVRDGHRVRSLTRRATVGAMGLFAEEPESNDCIAAEDTTALEMSAYDIYDIFEDNFALLRATIRGFASELLDMRRRLGASAGFGEPQDPALHPARRPLDLVERMAVLRRSMPFAESHLEAIADFAREAGEERFSEGATLWHAGDPAGHVLIPLHGRVACVSEDGLQRFDLGPDDAVGGLDALAERPRWCTVRARGDVAALRVDTESLHDVFEDHFETAMGFLRLLARNLLRLDDRAWEAAHAEPR